MTSLADQITQARKALRAGRPAEVVSICDAVLATQPDHPEAAALGGTASLMLGQSERAISLLTTAAEQPGCPAGLLCSLGAALTTRAELEEAGARFEQALRQEPDNLAALSNLASIRRLQGRLPEAIRHFARATRLAPQDRALQSSYLLTLNYLPGVDPSRIAAQHRAWGQLSAATPSMLRRDHDRDPDRRLRIGFVSRDFRTHSVAYFVAPLLRRHSRDQVECLCFSDVRIPDGMTERLRDLADEWHDTADLGAEALASLVVARQVDILIDLAGHTAENRLAVFARRVAPIQVSYIGYPCTTGLPQMDARIVDEVTDPPGAESLASERLIRLNRCFLCYEPPSEEIGCEPDGPRQDRPPAFCSFNNLAKMTPEVISVWAQLLARNRAYCLVLKNHGLTDQATSSRLHRNFVSLGVHPDQVQVRGWERTTAEHLRSYHDVDVALDTFPYNGTTTTLESLWMGVPVVTVVGRSHAARVGASLLTALGRREWIAQDHDSYLEAAEATMAEQRGTPGFRAGLNAALRNSSLCDAGTLTAQLEQHYRTLWQNWCTTGSAC